MPQFCGQKHDEDATALSRKTPEARLARRGVDNAGALTSEPSFSAPGTGAEKDGHRPCSVSVWIMASGAHSFFAHVRFPPDAQKPGVQLRASSHRSNGVPSAIGSSHPERDSAPASGQEASRSETRIAPKDAFAPRASRVASDEARVSGRDDAAAV
jgi:hypothetical protein